VCGGWIFFHIPFGDYFRSSLVFLQNIFVRLAFRFFKSAVAILCVIVVWWVGLPFHYFHLALCFRVSRVRLFFISFWHERFPQKMILTAGTLYGTIRQVSAGGDTFIFAGRSARGVDDREA